MEFEARPSQLFFAKRNRRIRKTRISVSSPLQESLEAAPVTTPVGRGPGGKKCNLGTQNRLRLQKCLPADVGEKKPRQ